MQDMVAQKPGDPIPPSISTVWLAPENPSIAVGGTVQLNATVLGTGAYDHAVVWTSANPATATVDAEGRVRGIATGAATITATSTFDPTKMSQTTVTVTKDAAITEPPKRDGQEEIDASKAPLMDHLIELRQRLIYSLIAFFGFFILCFALARPLYNILAWPLHLVAPQMKMIATHLLEELFTNIKLAMFGAMFLSFPFAAYQIYKFVAPGLYKNEKEAFRPYLLWTWLLFILGAMVVYFVVMPLLIKFSIGSIDPANFKDGKPPFELMPKIAEYLSLIMQLIMGFGIIFQLPVVLALLAQAGIITAQNLRDFKKYAIVAITAASAVLSPPDPFSMLAMMAPTIGLYYASIHIVARIEKSREAKEKAGA